jgi:hypothetical protein
MNFAAQALSTAAHDDVGKVAASNVPVDCSFADSQSFRSFDKRQKFLVIVRGNQFRFPPKARSRPTGTAWLLQFLKINHKRF